MSENKQSVQNYVQKNISNLVAKDGTEETLTTSRQEVADSYEDLGNARLDELEAEKKKVIKSDGRRSAAYLDVRGAMDKVEASMDMFADISAELPMGSVEDIIDKWNIQTGKAKAPDAETEAALKAQFKTYGDDEKKLRTELFTALTGYRSALNDHSEALNMNAYKSFAEAKAEDETFVMIAEHLQTTKKMNLASVCAYFIENYGSKSRKRSGDEKNVFVYKLSHNGAEFAECKSTDRTLRSDIAKQYPTESFVDKKGALEVTMTNGTISIMNTKSGGKGSLSAKDLANVVMKNIKGFTFTVENA